MVTCVCLCVVGFMLGCYGMLDFGCELTLGCVVWVVGCVWLVGCLGWFCIRGGLVRFLVGWVGFCCGSCVGVDGIW